MSSSKMTTKHLKSIEQVLHISIINDVNGVDAPFYSPQDFYSQFQSLGEIIFRRKAEIFVPH